jgi:hypothetical protein
MISITSAFAPSIDHAGLQVSVGPALLWISGNMYAVPPSVVFLTPNSTSYVFFNTSVGLIGVTNSGFSPVVIPIATVTTSFNVVSNLTDNRPDFMTPGSGGSSPTFSGQ